VRACRGRDHMVVGFITTYAISAYHHWCCEFEFWSGRSVQHYVLKFVSGLWQVCGLCGASGFFHQWNWPPRYNCNTVESGVKYYQTTLKLWVRILLMARYTQYNISDKSCQCLAAGRWYFPVLWIPPPIELTTTI
jgi:hypothetical protein